MARRSQEDRMRSTRGEHKSQQNLRDLKEDFAYLTNYTLPPPEPEEEPVNLTDVLDMTHCGQYNGIIQARGLRPKRHAVFFNSLHCDIAAEIPCRFARGWMFRCNRCKTFQAARNRFSLYPVLEETCTSWYLHHHPFLSTHFLCTACAKYLREHTGIDLLQEQLDSYLLGEPL